MGRESARFQSLVDYFWFGIAAATAIALVLGAAHRLVDSSRAPVRSAGNESHGRGHRRRRSFAPLADALGARTCSTTSRERSTACWSSSPGKTSNWRVKSPFAARREQALHRAHDDLEELVAQRHRSRRRTIAAPHRGALRARRGRRRRRALRLDRRDRRVLRFAPPARDVRTAGRRRNSQGPRGFPPRFPFHPDDRDRVITAIDGHFSAGTVRLEMEMRILRPGNALAALDRALLARRHRRARPLEHRASPTSPTASAPRTRCACRSTAMRSPWRRPATAIGTGISRPTRCTCRRCCSKCAGCPRHHALPAGGMGRPLPVLSRGTPRYAQAVAEHFAAGRTASTWKSASSRAANALDPYDRALLARCVGHADPLGGFGDRHHRAQARRRGAAGAPGHARTRAEGRARGGVRMANRRGRRRKSLVARSRGDVRNRDRLLRRHLRILEEARASGGLAERARGDQVRAGKPAMSPPNTASCT